MKILLDENLPKKLKVELGSGHEVFSVGEMKWCQKWSFTWLNGFKWF